MFAFIFSSGSCLSSLSNALARQLTTGLFLGLLICFFCFNQRLQRQICCQRLGRPTWPLARKLQCTHIKPM